MKKKEKWDRTSHFEVKRHGRLYVLPHINLTDIKWGSKFVNDLVSNYYWNLYGPVEDKCYIKEPWECDDLVYSLCNNTVIAAIAIHWVYMSIIELFEYAYQQKDDEKMYICFIRLKRVFQMMNEMGLNNDHRLRATFDNIILPMKDRLFSAFMFSDSDNLENHHEGTIDKWIEESPLSAERKKELEKQHGKLWSFQIPFNEHLDVD